MNKWIGWVEDAEGYMVRFIGPTSQGWAARKCREAREVIGEHNVSQISWTQLAYARSNKLSGCGRGDKWLSRLNEADLNVLINVVQG